MGLAHLHSDHDGLLHLGRNHLPNFFVAPRAYCGGRLCRILGRRHLLAPFFFPVFFFAAPAAAFFVFPVFAFAAEPAFDLTFLAFAVLALAGAWVFLTAAGFASTAAAVSLAFAAFGAVFGAVGFSSPTSV